MEILADIRCATGFGGGPGNFGIPPDDSLRRFRNQIARQTSSGQWPQARLEQPGKGRSHIDEDHRPQYGHEEGQREPARGLKAWKKRMLTITGASTATANGT